MILILDTDHVTTIQRQSEPQYTKLITRLKKSRASSACTTIISVEEQMRGWLSLIARTRNTPQEVDAYRRLDSLLTFFRGIPVLGYNEAAADQVAILRAQRVRVSSMDLRIAAIALAKDALLLSRNNKDFGRIPRLKVEDWTA
ncbi:MAG: type II toxin-antitoxin system VapC family toxin [Acidobacteriota bacterium]